MRIASAVLVLSALTLTSQDAIGQAKSAATTWGPFAAVNMTTFGGSDVDNAKNRMAFGFGVDLERTFSAAGFFRTGLHYAMRGAKADEGGVDMTFKLNYVEVPLILGYRFPTQGKVHPYVMGGGHFGFNVGCEVEGSQGGTTATIECDDPQLDIDVSSTDFGALAGGGLSFAVGANTMSVDLRYSLGLKEIAPDSDTKNRGFTLGVGYMIPLGGK